MDRPTACKHYRGALQLLERDRAEISTVPTSEHLGLKLSEGRNPGRLGSGVWHTHSRCWIINSAGTKTHTSTVESASEDVIENVSEQASGMFGEV